MNVTSRHAGEQLRHSPPGMEPLESRQLLSATVPVAVSHHAPTSPAESEQAGVHSVSAAARVSEASGRSEASDGASQSESSDVAAQQSPSSSSASAEGDGGATASASAATGDVSSPAAGTTSASSARSVPASSSAVASEQAAGSAANDGEAESAAQAPQPAATVTTPPPVAQTPSGKPTDSAANPASDPSLSPARGVQLAAASGVAQIDAIRAILKPAAPAPSPVDVAPHSLASMAAASVGLAGSAILSMQAMELKMPHFSDIASLPQLKGLATAAQLIGSDVSRGFAGAVAKVADDALPSAEAAVLAVAKLRDMISIPQLGNVAAIPRFFSLNALGSYADAIAEFAHESAIGVTLTQTSHHEIAWAVTLATLAADAILIGRWRVVRHRKRSGDLKAGPSFSRRQIKPR